MHIKYFSKLSKKAKEDLRALVVDKQAGFDMIVANYMGKNECNALDVTSRLQLQYFLVNPQINHLQSNGMNGWWQNESYEPNEVAEGLEPVVDTTDNNGEGERLFSSYALKQIPNKYSLSYPLDNDYTEPVPPFKGAEMPATAYQSILKKLEENLGVKVFDGKYSTLNIYRRCLVNLAITKVKNAFYRLTRNLDKVKTSFKGSLLLAQKSADGYEYSNIERVVKIHDELFRVAIAKDVRDLRKENKGKITKDVKFASRLFADILMARATDFGNKETNKKVESCLFLQFSNVLNRANFNSQQLKLITELGASVVCDTCKQNKMTKESVMHAMMQNGFEYTSVPKTMKEAFLLAKDKAYEKFATNTDEQENKTEEPKKQKVSKKKVIKKGNIFEEYAKNKDIKLPEIPVAGKLPELPNASDMLLLSAGTNKNNALVPYVRGELQNIEQETITHEEPKVNVKAVERVIDKAVIKLLSGRAVSVVRHLDTHDYAAVGGKEKGTKTARLFANVLAYYQNKTTSKRRDANRDGSEYKNAREITAQLIALKKKFLEFFAERDDIKDSEKYETYVNRVFREMTKNENNKDGSTLRAILKNGIDLVINKYVDDELKINDVK